MIKNDIGINSGIIWHLLSQNKTLSIRQIGEMTSFDGIMIALSLGWLARENKIRFDDRNGMLHIQLNQSLADIYY